jgi:antagonist of KipI
MAALLVIRPGLLTTVQDLGRRGFQGLGVPVAGPMDWYSHRLANQKLGNDPMAASLEVTLMGPELEADGDVVMAIAGADFDVTVGGTAVSVEHPFSVPSGARVRFGERRAGTRATLAVRGGFDLPVTLGSRATHLVSRMGPFDGRALRAGDRLPVSNVHEGIAAPSGRPLPLPDGGGRVRIVPAAHRDRFTDEAWTTLTGTRFLVTPQSNRMGYRLEGPPLTHSRGADMLSEAMPIGALQVPASGQPILLMADRQTTGGYPTIANVITADLPIAGQLAPGDWIEFQPCSFDEALEALREREQALAVAGVA